MAVDEQRDGNGDDDGAPGDACRPRSGDDRCNDERNDGGTDALEDAGEGGVVLDGVGGEEHGNGKNDAERGQDGAEGGNDAALEPAQTVADDRGDVNGKDARHGLCHSQQVEELIGGKPMVLVDNLSLDDADHGPSTAEGEEPNLEECYEEAGVQVFLIENCELRIIGHKMVV